MKTQQSAAIDSCLAEVQRHIETVPELTTGGRVLCALSGGADSTALAILLHGVGLEVALGHVDHRMRHDSHLDASHCSGLADRLGLPIEVGRAGGVPRTEAQAREVRYQMLHEMAESTHSQVIATGHTLNDHIETILMRLARGGRPFGIPTRRQNIIRPLLNISRRDTEAVCGETGVAYLEDPTNKDQALTRNRIRHRVVPRLSDAELEILRRSASDQARAAAELREGIEVATTAGFMSSSESGARIDLRWFRMQPPGMQEQSLRHLLTQSAGTQASSRLVRRLCSAVMTEELPIDLPGDWVATLRNGDLRLQPAAPLIADPPPSAVDLPGFTDLPGWGIAVATEWVGPPFSLEGGADEALIDAALVNQLEVRARRSGDRMRPLGMNGTKKVSDIFIDLHIPRERRPLVPVFTSGGRIVWIGGVGIDDRFRITSTTSRALRLRISRS